MRTLFICALLCQAGYVCYAQQLPVLSDTGLLQPIELLSIRAGEKTPVAKTNMNKKEIRKYNTGQDLPFLLDQTPSVIINSDAGNGIGYTGIRIRGTDASRINVTINGIPYNDAESQGTFFVDLPDIASSAGSIQIQRGVGTSTNGAGSFGGTINLGTNEIIPKSSLEFNNSAGSYHSFKNTLMINSGLLRNHFTLSGRISNIRSDGYVERAASRLNSFFTSAGYADSRNSFRLNIFSGKEKTYQAWYGVDENTLHLHRRYNQAGTEKPGEPYENETDNYSQTHYQLFYNHKFSKILKGNIAVFLTRGKGYYEEYKTGALLSDYGLPDYNNGQNIVDKTDLVRRLWLDNHFYGTIFSMQYEKFKTSLIAGAGCNRYDGKHFGELIWAKEQMAVPKGYHWYDRSANKNDFSGFVKWSQRIGPSWETFTDLQLRSVLYMINGFRDHPSLNMSNHYLFFNPKAGITFTKNNWKAYCSFGHAGKEPNRDDFEAGITSAPEAEMLNDFEAGLDQYSKFFSWGINLYYMLYKNQLVLTGKINDVGAYTRTNIPHSYRTGIEIIGSYLVKKWLSVNGNITLSENKIKNFTEYIDDYDNGGQQTKYYSRTDISFSPAVIGNISLNLLPIKNTEINIHGKYVGRQYLDNTSQRSRSLHDYFVQDLQISYEFNNKNFKSLRIFAKVNNILSMKYEANGYSFSYIYGGSLTTENYYFPMAPVNFMAGLNIEL